MYELCLLQIHMPRVCVIHHHTITARTLGHTGLLYPAVGSSTFFSPVGFLNRLFWMKYFQVHEGFKQPFEQTRYLTSPPSLFQITNKPPENAVFFLIFFFLTWPPIFSSTLLRQTWPSRSLRAPLSYRRACDRSHPCRLPVAARALPAQPVPVPVPEFAWSSVLPQHRQAVSALGPVYFNANVFFKRLKKSSILQASWGRLSVNVPEG